MEMSLHGTGTPVFRAETFAKNNVRIPRDVCTMDIHQLHRVGYTRVSSMGQTLDSQIAALKAAGCKKIITDKMTGSRMDRPGWDQLVEYVRFDDIPRLPIMTSPGRGGGM
jgi:predicted site-specific integrase-resolvase